MRFYRLSPAPGFAEAWAKNSFRAYGYADPKICCGVHRRRTYPLQICWAFGSARLADLQPVSIDGVICTEAVAATIQARTVAVDAGEVQVLLREVCQPHLEDSDDLEQIMPSPYQGPTLKELMSEHYVDLVESRSTFEVSSTCPHCGRTWFKALGTEEVEFDESGNFNPRRRKPGFGLFVSHPEVGERAAFRIHGFEYLFFTETFKNLSEEKGWQGSLFLEMGELK